MVRSGAENRLGFPLLQVLPLQGPHSIGSAVGSTNGICRASRGAVLDVVLQACRAAGGCALRAECVGIFAVYPQIRQPREQDMFHPSGRILSVRQLTGVQRIGKPSVRMAGASFAPFR